MTHVAFLLLVSIYFIFEYKQSNVMYNFTCIYIIYTQYKQCFSTDTLIAAAERHKLILRSSTCGDKGQQIGDEILAECAGVRYAVDVAALWAEIGVREVVEHHESKEKEGHDDGQGYGEQTHLLHSVPLADGDVRDKDEGGQDTKDEASDLSEVVDVGKCAQNCRVDGKSYRIETEIADMHTLLRLFYVMFSGQIANDSGEIAMFSHLTLSVM